MASSTKNLNLYKKNPLTDGDETFNIETILNENWEKIDEADEKNIKIEAKGAPNGVASLGADGKINKSQISLKPGDVGATSVEASTINGNIKIDGAEKTVYSHPNDSNTRHVTDVEKLNYADKYTKKEVDNKIAEIPKSSINQDGLMSKEDKIQVNKIPTIEQNIENNSRALEENTNKINEINLKMNDTMEVATKENSNYLTLGKSENEGLLNVDFKGMTFNNLFRPEGKTPLWTVGSDARWNLHQCFISREYLIITCTFFNVINLDFEVTIHSNTDDSFIRAVLVSKLSKSKTVLGANEYIRSIVGRDALGWLNTDEHKQLIKRCCICLDYDATSLVVSNYFSGMQSLFQNEGWVSNINTSSKNLLNYSNFKNVSANVNIQSNNLLRVSTLNPVQAWGNVSAQVSVKPFTDYTLSYSSKRISGDLQGANNFGLVSIVDLVMWKGFSEKYNNIDGGRTSLTFNSGNRSKIGINLYSNGGNTNSGAFEYWSIQLEEGTTLTDFQFHKENNLKSIISPLRRVDNNYFDEKIGNQIIRRCQETTYQDLTNITVGYSSNEDKSNSVQFSIYNSNLLLNGNALCDKFRVVNSGISTFDLEMIQLGSAPSSLFAILVRIAKFRLTGYEDSWTVAQKIDAFKLWVKSNPITIVHGLQQSISEPCTPIVLKSFKNTSVYMDSVIYPSELKVIYPRTLSACVSSANMAVDLKNFSYKGVKLFLNNWTKVSDERYTYNLQLPLFTINHSPNIRFNEPLDAEGVYKADSYNGGCVISSNLKIEKDLECLVIGEVLY